MRNCGWRAQLKPTEYCASIVAGGTSLRGVMPWLLSVSQRPVLAGQELQALRVPIHCAIDVADAQIVGVAFVGVGGLRAAQEVELAIEGQMGVGIDIALRQHRKPALARGEAQFRGVRRAAELEKGMPLKLLPISAVFVARTINAFRRQEAAQRHLDAAQIGDAPAQAACASAAIERDRQRRRSVRKFWFHD